MSRRTDLALRPGRLLLLVSVATLVLLCASTGTPGAARSALRAQQPTDPPTPPPPTPPAPAGEGATPGPAPQDSGGGTPPAETPPADTRPPGDPAPEPDPEPQEPGGATSPTEGAPEPNAGAQAGTPTGESSASESGADGSPAPVDPTAPDNATAPGNATAPRSDPPADAPATPPPPVPVDPALGKEIAVAFPVLDPWSVAPSISGLPASATPCLELQVPAAVRGTLHLRLADGRTEQVAVPEPVPTPWVIRPTLLPRDPWALPPGGLPIAWEVRDPTDAVLASGSGTARMISAEASYARLAERVAALEDAGDDAALARALEDAAARALRFGTPDRADRYVVALRALAPRLAARDATAARRSSIARVILAALVQRTYVDADPVHRRAALDRIERLGERMEEDPESSAHCAILLAEAALESLETAPDGAERRKLLDRARTLARSAREGERSAQTTLEAELLWARVSIARGWRTESAETLDRIGGADPRVVARVAALRAEAARLSGDERRVASEIDRAIAAVEALRRHAGSLEIDAGILHLARGPYRARVDRAARAGDGPRCWAALEAMRPRAPEDPVPDTAFLESARAGWGDEVSLLACADLGTALVSVRASASEVVVSRSPTPAGATRERVRALLRARGSDPAAAEWLSDRILRPHEGHLRASLALAPLGALRPVPFTVLPVGRRPLAEAHVTWSVPGAASVSPRFDAALDRGPVAAYVDPWTDYDGNGAPDRPRLPSTVDEAEAWADVPGGYARSSGVGAQESRLAAEAPWIRILHLGCHGEFARHRPFESTLLLAPGGGADGRLSARELSALDLSSCALVCLSGCETGLTRAEGGDDLAGFPRAVLSAGAGAFLGSLWPIEDESAGVFFRNFHAALQGGADPRTALREARRAARLDPERSAPRHWAAWVLLEK